MNIAYQFRIYPNQEQKQLFSKTFGCVRFIYNKMLSDKIEYCKETKKKSNNTPAQYKKDYEWRKEAGSLALANAQIHLQTAYHSFFRNPKTGFPKCKSKKNVHKRYTTIGKQCLKLSSLGNAFLIMTGEGLSHMLLISCKI